MNDINEHFPSWNGISWDKNLHDFHMRKLKAGDKISQEEFFKSLKFSGGNMYVKLIMAQALNNNNETSQSLELKDVNRFEDFFGKDYIKTIKLFSQFPNENCFRGFSTSSQTKDFIRRNVLTNPSHAGTYVIRCSEKIPGCIVFCVRVDEEIKKRLNYIEDKENTFDFRAELQPNGKYKFGERHFELSEIFKEFSWLLQKPYSKYKSYQPHSNFDTPISQKGQSSDHSEEDMTELLKKIDFRTQATNNTINNIVADEAINNLKISTK